MWGQIKQLQPVQAVWDYHKKEGARPFASNSSAIMAETEDTLFFINVSGFMSQEFQR